MKKITFKGIAYLLITSFLLSSVSIIADAEKPKPQKNNYKYKTTQIIVKYKDGFSYDSIKSNYERKVKKPKKQNKLKNTQKDILTVSSFEETGQAIETLNRLPEVEYAVPDDIIEAYGTGQALDAAASAAMGFENAYEFADGTGVTVAVLDTGLKTDLPEFRNRISSGGYDFANGDDTVYDDPSLDAHGTQVAGILAAAIRQPRSVPDLGYPTRKADTKAVKTHSGGHRAAEARQTAEGGCRTRTHTRTPSAAVTPVVPHRHGYASSSLSRFRMPGSTSCRTKSAKTPGIKLSC